MEEAKRTRRSKAEAKEQRIQKYRDEIAKHQEKIAQLEQKIKEEETPEVSLKDVTARIKELGVSPEEVIKAIEKLGKK